MTRKLFATQSLYSPNLLVQYGRAIFVFGDNQARLGKGGQAIIRDEPNARGIATKRIDLGYMEGSLADFEAVLRDLRNIEAIMDSGQQVVLPILENGDISIGCGLADLPRQAPSLYGMINDWFHDLEDVRPVRAQTVSVARGDTVLYVGPMARFNGEEGVVSRLTEPPGALVQFPNDPKGPRFFTLPSLRKVTKNMTMTIASRVKAVIIQFIGQAVPATASHAARELLAATLLCTAADAAKKRAKKQLIALGITLDEYRPGSIIAFDDSEFTITAVTKEPSSRLDQPTLIAQLRDAGLSQAKITSVILSATMPNKAATSILVTEK